MDVSLIYFLLVLRLMTEENNATADRLGLAHARITDLSQVRDFPVLPPRDKVNNIYEGVSAGLRTWNFNFGVRKDGVGLSQLDGPTNEEDWQDGDGRLGVPRGSVTTEIAYKQARAWMERLGVDVKLMEQKYPLATTHWQMPMSNRRLTSPRFSIKWVGPAEKGKEPKKVAEVYLNSAGNWLVRLDVNDLRFYRNPLPEIPHAIAINLLPDEPVRKFFALGPHDRLQRIFTEWGFRYTNALALLEKSPAYEARGREALLKEAKSILSILDCDQLDEPNERNLTDLYVDPPAFGSGGRLEFRNGEIQFDSNGRLRLFRFLPRGETNYFVWLSTKQSLISSNEAYQIATQKLAALSIDVEHLDSNYRRAFAQGRSYKYDSKRGRIWFATPEYWLEWRNPTNPFLPAAAQIAVFGDLKKVGQVQLRETRYWKRAPVLVSDTKDSDKSDR